MASEVGWAGLGIIPTFDKFGPELDRGVSKHMIASGQRGGQQFGDAAGKSAGGRFGRAFRTAAKVGLVGGAALGLGAYKLGKDSVALASDLQESLNAVNVSYRGQSKAVRALGRDAADSLGLSNSEFNSLAVRFSAFSKTIAGGDGKKVVTTLDDLSTRASDFASVMNLDVAEAAELFQSGLAGESEPLRRFGIDMSAAKVEAYAYAEGIAKTGAELTESEKVQARYGTLMEQTAKTQGDFANTSDSLANRQRILSARWDDARAKLGKGLLPIMEDAAGFLLDKGIPAFERFADWFSGRGVSGIADFGDKVKPLAKELLPAMGDALTIARDALSDALPYAKKVVDAFNNLPDGVKKGLVIGGGAIAAGKLLGGGGGGARGGAPSLTPGGLVSATKGAVVTKSGELLADRLLAKFQKPLPVVVTNPGFSGGGPGAGDGKGRGGKGGSRAGRGAGAASAALVLPALIDQASSSNVLDDWERLEELLPVLRDRFGEVKNTSRDLAGATWDLDKAISQTLARNPAKGFLEYRDAARDAGISMDELADLLPNAAKRIELTDAKAKAAKVSTEVWDKAVRGLDGSITKVDGKKPKVTWTNPGLEDGIKDSGKLDKGIKTVDGKKPKAYFSLPGISQRITEAFNLDKMLDEAAQDRSATITIAQKVANKRGIGVGQLMYGRAAGGPVQKGQTYAVGERGIEMFRPNEAGRIIPNHQIDNSRTSTTRVHIEHAHFRDGNEMLRRVRRRSLG